MSTIIEILANRLSALEHPTIHEDLHLDVIDSIMKKFAPSGSGFDSGTELDYECSNGGWNGKKVVFKTSFHHMNEAGYYDGWTEHKIIITPGFNGFDIKVTGKDRNMIKDYIADTFHHFLSQEIEPDFIRKIVERNK